MTELSKLKQRKPARKVQAPPSIDESPSVIEANPRPVAADPSPDPKPEPEKEPLKALSFKLPESVVKEFGELAYQAFGAKHGAKQELMMRMFESYKASVKVGGSRTDKT
ncbi:hypothetical protein ATO13_23521 [Stappia sp. 22II-S9-Z10]|nr:hypothetical protein ATO13_23521 [Stappia sp. 22II-S9-Z10]